MNNFLINLFRLTRPLSNVKNIALVLLAFYLSGQEFNLNKFILGIFSLSFACSAIYAYNAICDLEYDKNNKNKQHYSQAVYYFGEKYALIVILFLAAIGIFIGFYFNIYFLISLLALLITSFFYSSKYTRFKEKAGLDVLFGAALPFAFRFLAGWFVFSGSDPGLTPSFWLVILALVFAKTGGYLLYKEADRTYLEKLNIKNSITLLKKWTVILLSALCWVLAIASSFAVLPVKFLFLIIFAIPPLVVIYLSVLGIIKTEIKHLRIWGFIYWILVIIIALLFFL